MIKIEVIAVYILIAGNCLADSNSGQDAVEWFTQLLKIIIEHLLSVEQSDDHVTV